MNIRILFFAPAAIIFSGSAHAVCPYDTNCLNNPYGAGFVAKAAHSVDTMGVYGNYYLKRALITQWGLGANLPEDAIYPSNLGDEAGRPLDGANKYTLHFEKGATPPVNAFWSVTLYDAEGFQVPTASIALR